MNLVLTIISSLLLTLCIITVSKRQKALQKRYEEFQNAPAPKEDRVVLPVIRNPTNMHSLKISSLTYSITEGLKVKVINDSPGLYYVISQAERVTHLNNIIRLLVVYNKVLRTVGTFNVQFKPWCWVKCNTSTMPVLPPCAKKIYLIVDWDRLIMSTCKCILINCVEEWFWHTKNSWFVLRTLGV